MKVKDLIKKLEALPQEAEVVHINYQWENPTAFSEPLVFMNSFGECMLGTQEVGKEVGK